MFGSGETSLSFTQRPQDVSLDDIRELTVESKAEQNVLCKSSTTCQLPEFECRQCALLEGANSSKGPDQTETTIQRYVYTKKKGKSNNKHGGPS